VHTLRVSNLLTVYYVQLFKQMTQTSQSRSWLKKSFFIQNYVCSLVCVCVCVPMTKHAYIVVE